MASQNCYLICLAYCAVFIEDPAAFAICMEFCLERCADP